jgi:PKHD-type hydroxylase
MNLTNYYWYFTNALTPRFCDQILQYGKLHQEQIAVTGGIENKRDLKKIPLTKKELKNLQKIRNSNISWLDDKWIYKEIIPYVNEANKKAGWNFKWDHSEPCQFTKYSKGQYYGWHCDSWDKPYSNPNQKEYYGKIRKLSVTCTLSHPSEYTGGELEFNFNHPEQSKKQNIRNRMLILQR